MIRTTNAREIRVVGGGTDDVWMWEAVLCLTKQDKDGGPTKDFSATNRSVGLRTLVQEAEPTGLRGARLHNPRLLSGMISMPSDNAYGTNLLINFGENEPYAISPIVAETHPGAFYQVVLEPIDTWPAPSGEMALPTMRLVEGCVPVRLPLEPTKMAPAKVYEQRNGPLAIVQLDGKKEETYAFVPFERNAAATAAAVRKRMQAFTSIKLTEAEDGYAWVNLTPTGIDLAASINLARGFGATASKLRVERDGALREAGYRLRLAEANVQAVAFMRGLEHDINSSNSSPGLRVEFDVTGSARSFAIALGAVKEIERTKTVMLTSRDLDDPAEQKLVVAADAGRFTLTGDKAAGGVLRSSSPLAATPMWLSAASTGPVRFTIKNGEAVKASTELTFEAKAGERVISSAVGTAIAFQLDATRLAETLDKTYKDAGVRATDSTEPIFAYLPGSKGWLQLPCLESAPWEVDKSPSALQSVIELVDPNTCRRLILQKASMVFISGEVELDKPAVFTARFSNISASVDGVVWYASGSPQPDSILPDLGAGPASLRAPSLRVQASKTKTPSDNLFVSDSNTFNLAQGVARLSLCSGRTNSPTGFAGHGFWWRSAQAKIPVVTGFDLTRASTVSQLPSSNSDLLPLTLDKGQRIELIYPSGKVGLPEIQITAAAGPVPQPALSTIELPATTVSGLSFESAFESGAGAWNPPVIARYRHDLSLLDELNANQRLPGALPEAAPKGPTGVPITSLDMDGMAEIWRSRAHALSLAATRDRVAVNLPAFPSVETEEDVLGLYLPETIKTLQSSTIEGSVDGVTSSFGRLVLGGLTLEGESSFQGLSGSLTYKGGKWTLSQAKGDISVMGSALPLVPEKPDALRDQAGFSQARKSVQGAGLNVRVAKRLATKDGSTASGALISLLNPLSISNDLGRRLGFWFQDVWMAESSDGLPSAWIYKGGDLRAHGSAFDPTETPTRLHEWRFGNDPDDNDASPGHLVPLYDGGGPGLAFCPLRLEGVRIAKSETGPATVVLHGLIVYRDETDESKSKPFAGDNALAAGTPATVTISWPDRSHGDVSVEWQVASAICREFEDLQVDCGALSELSATQGASAALELTAKTGKLPQWRGPEFDPSASRLRVRLFGADVELKLLSINSYLDFDTAGQFFSGARYCIRDGAPCLALAMSLPILGDTVELAQIAWVGEFIESPRDFQVISSLRWLNLSFSSEPTNREIGVTVNHSTGVIDFTCSRLPNRSFEPIAGLAISVKEGSASLTVHIQDRKNPRVAGRLEIISDVNSAPQPTSTKPLFTGFRHSLQALLSGKSNEIEADIYMSDVESLICWPIAQTPDQLTEDLKGGQTDNIQPPLTSVSGRRLYAKFKAPEDVCKHRVSLSSHSARMDPDILTCNNGVVSLDKAWRFTAAASHHLLNGTLELTWTSVEQVTLWSQANLKAEMTTAAADVPTAGILPAPKPREPYAFLARYRTVSPLNSQIKAEDPRFLGPAIAERAAALAGFPTLPIAKALAGSEAKENKFILSGAGPVLLPSTRDGAATEARLIALPWLIDLEPPPAGNDKPFLPTFQASIESNKAFHAPDIDWAAGSAIALPRGPYVDAVLQSADASRMVRTGLPSAGALATVEQAIIDCLSPIEIASSPVWLRSLMTLKAIFKDCEAHVGSEPLQLPAIALAPDETDGWKRLAVSRQIFKSPAHTLQRRTMAVCFGRICAVLTTAGDGPDWSSALNAASERALTGRDRSHLMSLGRSRVAGLAAIKIWTAKGGIIFMEPEESPDDRRAFVSSAPPVREPAEDHRGWPTLEGIVQRGGAGSRLEIAIIAETAARDEASGQAWRHASFGFSPRAFAIDAPINFLSSRRKTVFDRKAIRVDSRPPRHLSASQARSIAPGFDRVSEAVKGATKPPLPWAIGIQAGRIDRTSLGVRPGALMVDFDYLTQVHIDAAAMDDVDPYFGVAADAGPSIARHVRYPHPYALPRLPLPSHASANMPPFLSHGRRTFVGLDVGGNGKDTGYPIPAITAERAVTILRLGNESYASYVLTAESLVLDVPALQRQNLFVLHVTSLGNQGQIQPIDWSKFSWLISLVIGAEKWTFEVAESVSQSGAILNLSLGTTSGASNRIEQILRRASGDTSAFISVQLLDRAAPPPPVPSPSPTAQAPRMPLATGILPVELFRADEAFLPFATRTFAFADPELDRALAGPGLVASQWNDQLKETITLGLDRYEYGPDTSVNLAWFDGKPGVAEAVLTISSAESPRVTVQVRLSKNVAYTLSHEWLLSNGLGGRPFLTFTIADGPSLVAHFVEATVQPGAGCVYSIAKARGDIARTALHGCGLPATKLWFPDILTDLKNGFVRRQALFEWRIIRPRDYRDYQPGSPISHILVKVDRFGGGQMARICDWAPVAVSPVAGDSATRPVADEPPMEEKEVFV